MIKEGVIRISGLMIDITPSTISETTEMIDVEDTQEQEEKAMMIMSTTAEITEICEQTIMNICMVAEGPMKNMIVIMITGLIMIAKGSLTTSMITIGIMMTSMIWKRIDKMIDATKMIRTSHPIIDK